MQPIYRAGWGGVPISVTTYSYFRGFVPECGDLPPHSGFYGSALLIGRPFRLPSIKILCKLQTFAYSRT